MNYEKIKWDRLGVWAEIATFAPHGSAGGVVEYHAILHVEPRGEMFGSQLERLTAAEELLSVADNIRGAQTVCKRYFVSDAANQQPLMRRSHTCAVSIIQQPPLDGSKVALWVYLQRGTEIREDRGMTIAQHNGYSHLWMMGMTESGGDAEWQTERTLGRYVEELGERGATLAGNCVRTWFYVRDVDTQYAGMVKARRRIFDREGLTAQTHYITSTGIGGLPAGTASLVQLDTYAMTGLTPTQQRYLYAPSHLNRTIDYGVTFERGTLVEYGDRGHIYISGTASIDNQGRVVHPGDIVRQTERMWENVGALLAEGGMTFGDMAHIIVYLRDMADYAVVRQMFTERFPGTPCVITLAPVCRPAWLVEMECVAIDSRHRPQFRCF